MTEVAVLTRSELPPGAKKTVVVGDRKILLVHQDDGTLRALEGECPHAKAPLEKGALCNGRLICPWHVGTFEIATGAVVEPPPLRGLQTFSARWQGELAFVDPEPHGPASVTDPKDASAAGRAACADKHVVLVGGGAAAAAALTTLREEGFAGAITLVDPDDAEPVDRTSLTKAALSGEKQTSALPLFTEGELAKLVTTRRSAKVTALDAEARTLETSDGGRLTFDLALLATGGTPRKLGIDGETLPHVHAIRHVADVEAIARQLVTSADGGEGAPKRAVIVGDSFIAFEAASALTARKLAVTVVARAQVPFAPQLGPEIAQALLALHRQNGVALELGAEARSFAEAGVTLGDGRQLPADVILVAVGVEPVTGFAPALAKAKDGTFAVGRDLLAAPSVWVAGDAATVDGTHIEHWRLAQQHGRAAAYGMLRALGTDATGRDARAGGFHGVPFFWTLHFGKRLGYVGRATDDETVTIDGDLASLDFLAYFTAGDQVNAVVGCGRDAALAWLAERIRRPLTLDEAKAAVATLA